MKIIFAGTPAFAVPALQALINSPHEITAVYTQPDRPAGRGRHLMESPVKTLARQYDLPVFQPVNFKQLSDQEIFKHLKPDLFVVAAYGLILPKIILDIPVHGCMNIHASLLPRFRGASPLQQAILSGDTQTGITIMRMAEGLDTGPVLYQLKYTIKPTETILNLDTQLSVLGAEGLMFVLNHFSHLTPQNQDDSQAVYAPKIKKSDVILNFNLPAIQCERAVRAFYPAQALLKNQLIKIWAAEVIPDSMYSNSLHHPDNTARILRADKHGIDVGTPQGILRLLKLQLPGGKVLSVQEMLNARAELFSAGAVFNI